MVPTKRQEIEVRETYFSQNNRWSVWTKLKLFRGEDSKTDERSLGEILVDKANRGVKVCVMVWDEADAAQKFVGMGTHDEETYNYFQTTSK